MTTQLTRKEHQHLTAVWRNGGFSASYDSFVGQQTVVLRINICGKNPPLRQAAKRYATFYENRANNRIKVINLSFSIQRK